MSTNKTINIYLLWANYRNLNLKTHVSDGRCREMRTIQVIGIKFIETGHNSRGSKSYIHQYKDTEKGFFFVYFYNYFNWILGMLININGPQGHATVF